MIICARQKCIYEHHGQCYVKTLKISADLTCYTFCDYEEYEKCDSVTQEHLMEQKRKL